MHLLLYTTSLTPRPSAGDTVLHGLGGDTITAVWGEVLSTMV